LFVCVFFVFLFLFLPHLLLSSGYGGVAVVIRTAESV